jgi:dTDP-4-dehydrorhamnose reductase
VLGAAGMLGHDLITTAPPEATLVPTTRVSLDVTDGRALERWLDEHRPAWVVNASGYTDVDRAEREQADVFAVNDVAVGTLGRLCAVRHIGVVHFSSDYVFDGRLDRPYREDDAPNPLNVYGRSKYGGERRLLTSGAEALVVRAQWLFGVMGRSFPRTMAERARAGLPTQVVSDQRGRPSSTLDVARTTWSLIQRGATGVFHIANRGDATWLDVAQHIFASRGLGHLVTACTSSEAGRAARRPKNSVLDTEKVEHLLNSSLPDWRIALDRFLEVIGPLCAR